MPKTREYIVINLKVFQRVRPWKDINFITIKLSKKIYLFILFVSFSFQKKNQCYMRALFDYEPNDDTLLPCKEIGLPFENGDILQVFKE